jgi:uncharacterized protein YjbI with pentapeptide repeats
MLSRQVCQAAKDTGAIPRNRHGRPSRRPSSLSLRRALLTSTHRQALSLGQVLIAPVPLFQWTDLMPDTSAKPKTREELEKEWWDRWWAEDYSWEGLADETYSQRLGQQKLQDYWRRDPSDPKIVRCDQEMIDAGELIKGPDDRLWHIAHVPMRWRSGESAKLGWSISKIEKLNELVLRRIAESQETKFEPDPSIFVNGPDGRAHLQGIVLSTELVISSHSTVPVHLNLSGSFIQRLDACKQKFGNGTDFSAAYVSGSAVFLDATFCGSVSFAPAIFCKDANFRGSAFLGECNFWGAMFRGPAEFDNAKFQDEAIFKVAEFGDVARFEHVEFGSFAKFEGAKFQQRATFHRARILKDAHFRGARFGTILRFGEAVFEEQAFFERVVWPETARGWHNAFDRVNFKGRASFHGSGARGFAAFDRAVFERGIQFDDRPESELQETFSRELDGALSAAEVDLTDPGDLKTWREIFASQEAEEVQERERVPFSAYRRQQRLLQLERGCRVLKQEMQKDTDKSREHMFYRFELMARHAQSTTPWQERWASNIYEAVSDYGTSITRPLMWLLLIWACASLVYVSIGVVVAPDDIVPWQWSWDAFDLSLSRVFQPLTFWSEANLKDNSLGRALIGDENRGLLALCVRVIGVAQSLISIILLFLSGLALRRRFQINN